MTINDHRALTEERYREIEKRVDQLNDQILHGEKISSTDKDLLELFDHTLALETRNLNMSKIVLALNGAMHDLGELPSDQEISPQMAIAVIQSAVDRQFVASPEAT